METIQMPAVVLRIIIFAVCSIAFYLAFFKKHKKKSEDKNDKEESKIKKEKYLVFLILLTSLFVVVKWKDIINFEFFKSFNGGNLIFIIWLFLLLLPLFDIIELFGVKLSKNNLPLEFANNIVEDLNNETNKSDADKLAAESKKRLNEIEANRGDNNA